MNDMTLPEHTPATIRLEMWLTLARAFQAPSSPAFAEAALGPLAADLKDFATEAGFDADTSLAALGEAIERIDSPTALLVQYSRLFLSPPSPAQLNLGFYLDGVTNGPALDAMDVWRSRYGIAQRESVKGLPDQLPIQLEFIAYLASHENDDVLGDYISSFLAPALPRMLAALDDAGFADTVYRALLAFTLDSIRAAEKVSEPDAREVRRKRRHDVEVGVWRHCGVCGMPYAREKEIQIMLKALAVAGLPGDHLTTCPDCRTAAQGSLPSINR